MPLPGRRLALWGGGHCPGCWAPGRGGCWGRPGCGPLLLQNPGSPAPRPVVSGRRQAAPPPWSAAGSTGGRHGGGILAAPARTPPCRQGRTRSRETKPGGGRLRARALQVRASAGGARGTRGTRGREVSAGRVRGRGAGGGVGGSGSWRLRAAAPPRPPASSCGARFRFRLGLRSGTVPPPPGGPHPGPGSRCARACAEQPPGGGGILRSLEPPHRSRAVARDGPVCVHSNFLESSISAPEPRRPERSALPLSRAAGGHGLQARVGTSAVTALRATRWPRGRQRRSECRDGGGQPPPTCPRSRPLTPTPAGSLGLAVVWPSSEVGKSPEADGIEYCLVPGFSFMPLAPAGGEKQ